MTDQEKKLIEQLKIETFLKPLESPEDIQNWFDVYLGIKLPYGHVYEHSNSSPIEACWEVYNNYKNNLGNEQSGYIWLSSRDSYKTLSESMLNVLLMAHFKCTIAHLAAIESQASKALSYINGFVKKIKPYLTANNIDVDGQSKRQIKLLDGTGKEAYVLVIIATVSGANSAHTNILSVDEIDVMRFPQAYKEAQFIPGVENGQFPLTIKTSTRKYAFGLMSEEIKNIDKTGDKLLQWNIIDVTEKCPDSRSLKHTGRTEKVWIRTHKLPLSTINQDKYETLSEQNKEDYTEIEAYEGCLKCPLLPICQKKLAHRPEEHVGDLYKPIDFTIGQFKKNDPEMAEAQLLCWSPTTKGLVYPRFDETLDTGNVLSLKTAWEKIFGEEAPLDLTLEKITEAIKNLDVNIYAGVDWGYRHDSTIVILAKFPNFSIILDTYASSGLEVHEFKDVALEFHEKYNVSTWFCDTAAPANIKTFRKAGLKVKDFKKDVMGGIEAIRSQILAGGTRKLFVLKTEQNQLIISGFKFHHFKLNAAGNPTNQPDDEEFSDIMDALRYLGQNLFSAKREGGILIGESPNDKKPDLTNSETLKELAKKANSQLMKGKIMENVVESKSTMLGTQVKNKKIFWNTD